MELLPSLSNYFSSCKLELLNAISLTQVVSVVNLLINEITNRGQFPPERELPFPTGPLTETPSDNRSKLLNEMLQTERTYITGLAELNVLSTYKGIPGRTGCIKSYTDGHHFCYIFKYYRTA
jgi:hypothetical protein